jgi:hypothetical protein
MEIQSWDAVGLTNDMFLSSTHQKMRRGRLARRCAECYCKIDTKGKFVTVRVVTGKVHCTQ